MNEASLTHDTGQHPECADRMRAIDSALGAASDLEFDRLEAPAAADHQILAVHSREHLDLILGLAAAGGGVIDADTMVSAGSASAALAAAGGSIAAVEAVLTGAADFAFALHRPPGHHAEPNRAMGFCLFSNAAVAARCAIGSGLARRPLILDWDVHHGNGTEAVFAADPDVLFISIHQSPLWPGTGGAGFSGTGAGQGSTLNIPVPAGSGDREFTSIVEHVVGAAAAEHGADLILISAGFDAHVNDPLASCTVSTEGFRSMAASVGRTSAHLGIPVAAVLEGGYNLQALGEGVVSTLRGFAAPDDAPSIEPTDISSEALERFLGGRGSGHVED